nr:hypothetical protein [Tanacetum cinerariifolium]
MYGALIPKEMLNEYIRDSIAYKTYYVYASEPTKKPGKAKKDVTSTKKTITKPKPTKKKTPVKDDRGKGLNILSEVSLSEAAQLKEVTKRSKKDFHIFHASGSGTGTKPGVPDVPKYESKNDKESWGDSGEEDDADEDDTKDDDD